MKKQTQERLYKASFWLGSAFEYIGSKVLWFLSTYWRRLLLVVLLGSSTMIAGLGISQVYAGALWLGIMVCVDVVIAWKTRDMWLWPVVHMLETQWYGKPLEKDVWSATEKKKFKKEFRFLFWRR